MLTLGVTSILAAAFALDAFEERTWKKIFFLYFLVVEKTKKIHKNSKVRHF